MITWSDGTQPVDVRRQRRELARLRWHTVQPWLLLASVVVAWEFISYQAWKGLLK